MEYILVFHFNRNSLGIICGGRYIIYGSLIEKEWRKGGIYAMMVTGELRGPATWMVRVSHGLVPTLSRVDYIFLRFQWGVQPQSMTTRWN